MTVVRWVYSGLGLLFFGLGVIGMFIPVLPTVPFWLLTAACFMRGSPRLYHWLMTHPRYGEYIYFYRDRKAVTPRSRTLALVVLWLGIGLSTFVVPLWWVKILLLVIAVGVSIHLLRMDILRPGDISNARDKYQEFLRQEFGE